MTGASVAGLVTTVELVPGPRRADEMAVTAVLAAELADGRRVTLLDDRGWASSGPPGWVWRTERAEIEFTARTVVGPDEPPPHRTAEQEAMLHWEHLAVELRRVGVAVGAEELRSLRHDVEIGPRLAALLATDGAG